MNRHLRFPLLLWLVLTSVGLGQDSVPQLVNYQGRLVDPAGEPLSNGTYEIQFALFNSTTAAANLIWGASYNVAVVDGQFNVVLGAAGGTPVPGAAVNDIGYAFGGQERYLEMSLIDGAVISAIAPRQQILSAPYALNGAPAGGVMPFAGTQTPAGWLSCDGQSLDAAVNPELAGLFAAIGKTYGPGDGGSSSFNLPDLRGRTVVGAGAGPFLVTRTLAARVGTDTITQVPFHRHDAGGLITIANGNHRHTRPHDKTPISNSGDYNVGEGRRVMSTPAGVDEQTTGFAGNHTHIIAGSTANNSGGVSSVDNLQPSLVLNYIIKM